MNVATASPARRALFASNALPLAIFLVFALVPLFASLIGQAHVLSLVTRVMIFSIAALALDLLIGYGALVSFGHAAFVGLGAYAVGILASHGINDALVSLPVALGVSALFALKMFRMCLPFGARSGSTIVGTTGERKGRADGRPYLASS